MKWKEMSMSIKTNDVMASEVFKSMITKCVSTNENPVVDKVGKLLRSDRTGDVAEQLEKLIGMQNRKFRSFTYDQRLTFCRVMRFEEHDTRKIVIKEGHAAQAFYFILTGEVIVFRIKDNHWIQLNILGRGESFGDRSMNVLNDKRTAYIATNKRSQFLVVDKTGMKRVNLLLTVAELGPGDCFPLLPWPHATPPMTPFDKAEFEHSLALDDVAASWNWTNSSVITTSTVEVVVVPRRDLVRIAPGEMLCEMTTDTFNGTTLHAVQAAFIEKQRWDGFKRKTINEVTRRKSRT
nr:Cyclic nucleotide-binding domain-containing protein 2 [Polyrhizophydium stewartii]